MSADDRFYLMKFPDGRPVKWGDIGSNLRIQGLVVGGNGVQVILLLPGFEPTYDQVITLSDEDWSDFIHASDDPQILVGPAKIFQRKVRYEISGAIQQKVWFADSFFCAYCGISMGKAKMTIDHFIPLELGGHNDPSNFLTACAACNKKKANMDPRVWCDKMGIKYEDLVAYLKKRKLP